jgi:hypothetical protein
MLSIPDELELLDFFETIPLQTTPEEGFYCYQVSDKTGITLIISFRGIDGSFQIRLKNAEGDLALFCQEGATRLILRNDASGKYLYCEFELGKIKTSAEVRVFPKILVKWNTLLN